MTSSTRPSCRPPIGPPIRKSHGWRMSMTGSWSPRMGTFAPATSCGRAPDASSSWQTANIRNDELIVLFDQHLDAIVAALSEARFVELCLSAWISSSFMTTSDGRRIPRASAPYQGTAVGRKPRSGTADEIDLGAAPGGNCDSAAILLGCPPSSPRMNGTSRSGRPRKAVERRLAGNSFPHRGWAFLRAANEGSRRSPSRRGSDWLRLGRWPGVIERFLPVARSGPQFSGRDAARTPPAERSGSAAWSRRTRRISISSPVPSRTAYPN